jgi:hypothetical protein
MNHFFLESDTCKFAGLFVRLISDSQSKLASASDLSAYIPPKIIEIDRGIAYRPNLSTIPGSSKASLNASVPDPNEPARPFSPYAFLTHTRLS